jgi:polyhydroxyalkanoate synthase subunit PhaC
VKLAPTPRDVVFRDGSATLYRFRAAGGADVDPSPPAGGSPVVLLVPSVINRWYVLDLRAGGSVVESLVRAGTIVYCLDWGEPGDEDRYLEWDDLVARIHRAVRRIVRATGAPQIGLLGYCMGGTLAAIATALEPSRIGAFVNLAGPIDFSEAGILGHWVRPRWFDAHAIASAGNIAAPQMQAGFAAMRPTAPLAKWFGFFDRLGDPDKQEAFDALEAWANDNIAFPAAAYVRYIQELYQENRLIRGDHWVSGRRVDLGRITCPVLSVVATRDGICPRRAAEALGPHTGSSDARVLAVPGGHVGAVVGKRASEALYPELVRFFKATLPAVSSD